MDGSVEILRSEAVSGKIRRFQWMSTSGAQGLQLLLKLRRSHSILDQFKKKMLSPEPKNMSSRIFFPFVWDIETSRDTSSSRIPDRQATL